MERRDFLQMTGAGLAGACGDAQESRAGRPHIETSLRTPLCARLGIDVPILQSGMGRVAGPELAAEVSNAGGLGILAGLGLSAEELRSQIRRTRALTDRPFGVNLWLHEDLAPPVDASQVDSQTVASVQATLDRFRVRLDLPLSPSLSGSFPNTVEEALEVIVEDRVPVWSIGLGDPGPVRTRRCHERGIQVMAMVATVADAQRVAASGVDVIVAQGGEAGGHRSTWVKPDSPEKANVGTLALVPRIADAVDVPVVAAGGIADGRGVVAALALGAQGVLLGTRFVATRESVAPELWKQALLRSDVDDTTITDAFTGLYARALRNRLTEEYRASGAPVLPGLLQAIAASDIFRRATELNDPDYFPLMSGQSVGLIEKLEHAGDVVRSLARETLEVMDSLRQRADSKHGR